MSLNESIVEDAALTWFGELGYAVGHGPHHDQTGRLAARTSVVAAVMGEDSESDSQLPCSRKPAGIEQLK